jgi:hypothetical protein
VSGTYDVRLYVVAENTGMSIYRMFAGDDLLGTYEVPVTDQAVELGTEFRGAWDNVQVNAGDEIRVEADAGTLDNTTWTRAGWQKITFMAQVDPNNVSTAPSREQPRLAPAQAATGMTGAVHTLDGRRAPPGVATAVRAPIGTGVYIVQSLRDARRLIAR